VERPEESGRGYPEEQPAEVTDDPQPPSEEKPQRGGRSGGGGGGADDHGTATGNPDNAGADE
jgi:hypothetical protein